MVPSPVEETLPLRAPQLFSDGIPGRAGLIQIMGEKGIVIYGGGGNSSVGRGPSKGRGPQGPRMARENQLLRIEEERGDTANFRGVGVFYSIGEG